MFRKTKPVVGLDIGSSAVKVVELRRSGRSFKVVGFGTEPVPGDTIVDGAIIDAAAVADAVAPGSRRQPHQDEGRRRLAVGQRRHRQEDQPAGDDRGRTLRVDSLGGRAVHPVRHPGRQPRLPDPLDAVPATGKGSMEVLLVAAKKDKITDYTDVINKTGRTPGRRRRRRVCGAERLRGELRRRSRARSWRCSTSARAASTSTSSPATSRCSPATSRSGGTPSPRRSRRNWACPSTAPSGSKKGEPMDGVDPADVRADPADRDREPAARDPEDVRLLQGDGGVRPDRPRAGQRRDVAGRRLRRSAGRALRRRRWSCSTRSGRSRFDAKHFGIERAEDVAPTSAVAVGLALRRAGDR